MRCRSAPSGPSRTGCWCAGTSSGSSTSGRGPCRRGSVDGERALHARGLVAGDRAVERVGAGLQVGGGRRRLAVADRLAVDVDAVALDRDRVRELGRVGHLERDLAGLGGEARLVELQRALVGRQLEGLAAAAGGGARVRARRGTRGAARLLVAAPAAREREHRGDSQQGHPAHWSSFHQNSRPVRTSLMVPSRSLVTTLTRSYSPTRAAVVSRTFTRPWASARNVPALVVHFSLPQSIS